MTADDNEHYDLTIPEAGLDYDILDLAFNPTTQSFIEINGIQPGMRILDVGSGSGIMTHYLSTQTGPEGQVLSIDNSLAQLTHAERYCQTQGDKNIRFKHLSAYDIDSLKETFDLIYCRFVLHHLQSPRQTIQLFYQVLNKGGIYIAEEGIISAAFSYPPSKAWLYNRDQIIPPEKEKDGITRDGEFGMKLFYWMKKAGFTIKDTKLVQPMFTTFDQKKKLLTGHDAYKKTALKQGTSEAEWESERQELLRLASDEFTVVGFYQSCQVSGIK
jgi:SAM-dependent methyltransferase